MRTRNILAGLSALAMMAFATGCNDDLRPDINQGGNSGAEDGPGVYMGVSFTMPTHGGTRSWTDGPNSSNNGEEIGTEIENNVNEVLLVLARKADNAFICSSTVSKNSLTIATGAANKTYQAKAKFSLDNLQRFYADADVKKNDAGNYDINVFVFCNSTKEIVDAVASAEYGNTEWVNTYANVTVTGQQTEGSIWSSTDGGSFLMSNVEIATREIPGAIDIWDNYTTSDKCFHLSHVNEGSSTIDNGATGRGAVKVERAAARFDFRDASDNKDQTYPVLYTINAAGEQENLVVSVRLTKMGLVNMSNRFYYLPRVSDNGLMTGANYELCGTEKPWYSDAQGTLVQGSGNYVVGPYADNFVTTGGVTTNFSNYFNYPFFNNDGTIDNNIQNGDRWSTIVIRDLLEKGSNDNWENSQQESKKGTYKVWRYATENVIPGIEQQVNGISTGVVFKAKMIGSTEPLKEGTTLPQNEKDVIAALNSTDPNFGDHESAPILYKHDGRLYYKFKNLYDAAIAASFSYTFDDSNNIIPSWNRSNSLYKALFGNGGTGYSITLRVPDMTPGAAEGAMTDVTYSDDLAVSEDCVYKLYTKWRELATGKVIDENAGVAFKKAATDPDNANITLYQRSYDVTDGWGYYCYYYYWNRHNDNGKNGIMGPMEFDVVRNNVYKLAVTTVKDLGHPRISENDPNKPKPGTPDEETKIYMTVDAEVIPWVVRVNDIVFE